MTERWQRELRKVRQLTPSPEVMRHSKEMVPERPTAESSIGRRLGVAVVVLAIAGASLVGLWRAFDSVGRPSAATPGGPSPSQTVTPSGYYITFPADAESPSGTQGGAILHVQTNLPDGTKVYVSDEELGGGGGSGGCCSTVTNGEILVRVDNVSCMNSIGQDRSTGLRITLTVLPDLEPLNPECLNPDGCPNPQPKEVLAILGDHFENLDGDQVRMVDGMRGLMATAEFAWPPGTCDPSLRGDSFLPDRCTNAETQMSYERASEVPGDLIGIFDQLRICEMWGDGTDGFRSANPWSDFRDQMRSWVEGLGPLVSRDGNQNFLRADIIDQSPTTFSGYHGIQTPTQITARYFYKDRAIAEATFVASPGSSPSVVPNWRLSAFRIL